MDTVQRYHIYIITLWYMSICLCHLNKGSTRFLRLAVSAYHSWCEYSPIVDFGTCGIIFMYENASIRNIYPDCRLTVKLTPIVLPSSLYYFCQLFREKHYIAMIIELRKTISVTHVTFQLYIYYCLSWKWNIVDRKVKGGSSLNPIACIITYRSRNRHQKHVGAWCVSSWWPLVWLGSLL